jgi:hypothetical protein
MARRSSVDATLAAIVLALKSSTGVTGLATGGIFNNVPQNTPYPYVVVTSPTDRREDTCGRFGSVLLVDVKAVSQYDGDKEAAGILDQCIQALNFQKPAASGHTVLGMTWENSERFQEVVNGIPTRHHVATLRVWTEQSSS